jgi:23S rRNA pseudouridine955/2504/2580 synthase/23S rRNA pseudouridine1911/1915/1917 synthase
MSKSSPFLSFPPKYLGSASQKFPLIANTDGFYAINKPSGMSAAMDKWAVRTPDFSMALLREMEGEKPQLKRLGIEIVSRVNAIDPELSGVSLFAKNKDSEEFLRNAIGSREMTFVYDLLVEPDIKEKAVTCDLPIARHDTEPRALISRGTGRKTETAFRHRKSYGRYHLWEASTNVCRPHQIRLHAAESGLRVVGEGLYAISKPIFLSSLKRNYRRGGKEEKPLYNRICIHLRELQFKDSDGSSVCVKADLPKGFAVVLKKLEQFGR